MICNDYLIVPANGNPQPSPEGWKEVDLNEHKLYTHPDLPIHVNQTQGGQIILLGFAGHISYPGLEESQLLDKAPQEESAFLDFVDHLSGSFILIKQEGSFLEIHLDCIGTFKCFYSLEDASLRAASRESLLADYFGIKDSSEQQVLAFYSSSFFQKNKIRLGSISHLEGVSQLLPNHKLRFSDKNHQVERIFPRKIRQESSLDNVIPKLSETLNSIVKHFGRNQQLWCTLTAGFDSRVGFAACLGSNVSVEYLTFLGPYQKPNGPDLKVPKKITKSLQLSHRVVESFAERMPKGLRNHYSSHFYPMDERRLNFMEGLRSLNPTQKNLLILGFGSEITKNYYDDVIIEDGQSLAKAAHLPNLDLVLKYCDNKFNELSAISSKFDYHLADLAHWEQDITNFAGQHSAYLNAVLPALPIFNCRKFIDTALSTKRSYRDKQNHKLYRDLLSYMAPELDKFPINNDIKTELIRWGKRLGVYGTYKKISTKLRR